MEVAASTLCSNRVPGPRSLPPTSRSYTVLGLDMRPGQLLFTRRSDSRAVIGGPVGFGPMDVFMREISPFQGRGRGRGEEAEREEGPVFGTRNVVVNNG